MDEFLLSIIIILNIIIACQNVAEYPTLCDIYNMVKKLREKGENL